MSTHTLSIADDTRSTGETVSPLAFGARRFLSNTVVTRGREARRYDRPVPCQPLIMQ